MDRRSVAARRAAAVLAVVAGCALFENGAVAHRERRSIDALGPGFIDPSAPPTPEAMIQPRPGSWDRVHPPRGYRVVLLTDDGPATTALVTAVNQWAAAERVNLDTVAVRAPEAVRGIVRAMDFGPDLVVCVGNALVDALALVTPSHLDQQFLIVGAQLPEPTINVTAAIWQGASSRGSEVPDTTASFDAAAFTPRHAAAAIRAGVASVLSDITGIAIWLE